MTACQHRNLELLPEGQKRLRCRSCHLTITEKELGDGFCPECFEETGRKRYDFEPVPDESAGRVRYRCEECGVIIESRPAAR